MNQNKTNFETQLPDLEAFPPDEGHPLQLFLSKKIISIKSVHLFPLLSGLKRFYLFKLRYDKTHKIFIEYVFSRLCNPTAKIGKV